MKRYLLALLVMFMTIVITLSCSKKQSGAVGQAIDITVKKTSENITKYLWAFKTKPSDSKLDPRDFLPSDDAEAVSFVPDVPGDYEVIVAMIDVDGKEYNETFAYDVTGEPLPEKPAEESPAAEDNSDMANRFGNQATEQAEQTPEAVTPVPVVPSETTADAVKTPKPAPAWKEVPENAVKTSARTATTKTAAKPGSGVDLANSIPKIKSKFTVQISSFRTYERAKKDLDALKKAGIDAEIQRAYFKDSDELWYRVRAGNFSSKQDARALMNQIKTKTGKPCWIDNVREDS